jgi:hypothetical protein
MLVPQSDEVTPLLGSVDKYKSPWKRLAEAWDFRQNVRDILVRAGGASAARLSPLDGNAGVGGACELAYVRVLCGAVVHPRAHKRHVCAYDVCTMRLLIASRLRRYPCMRFLMGVRAAPGNAIQRLCGEDWLPCGLGLFLQSHVCYGESVVARRVPPH